MGTIITRLPYVSADAAALSPLDITDAEIALYNSGMVSAWYRAADGWDESAGLTDRMGSTTRLAPVTVAPTRTDMAAYNGKPALVYGAEGASSGDMRAAGKLPTNSSFTIALVGRHGPSDNANLVGNDNDAGLTVISQSSLGAFTFLIGGTTVQTNTGTVSSYYRPYAGGPSLVLASWDNDAKSSSFRIQRGEYERISTTGFGAVVNTEGTLHVGAAGTASSGRVGGGDIAEIMILPVALHATAHADLRATIEDYLGTRYGIAAP
ncbi:MULTISPECIES: hypothetical protein [unclassified Xanthobacter]|uniref:hypothetical protein n=1 Tax=unclassified Xanthobacter TaxID=2623496 RepID=UPI001EDCE6CE|nr:MULTISPECIES: hypothetical protein [unclassified Xanthobacter]